MKKSFSENVTKTKHFLKRERGAADSEALLVVATVAVTNLKVLYIDYLIKFDFRQKLWNNFTDCSRQRKAIKQMSLLSAYTFKTNLLA